MAATNFTPIILYHTTTASAAPTAGNLNNGELAINITDGKLFYKDNGGTVQVIATKGTGTIGGSNTQVQYNSSGALAGSANFTFNGTTATINTLNLTNALGTAYGGTALTTYTQGDLVYASAANTLAKLGIGANTYILTSTGSVPQWSAPSAVTVSTANNLAGGAAGSVPYQSGASTTTFLSIGSAGQVLTSSGSAPQWSNLSSLGVTSLSFGTTGLTPSTATQGAITVAGTLATANGGTGLTSFTANGVFYASSTSAVGQSANLTFDGTTLVASNLTDSSLTTGRVVYTTTGGNLTDSANLLYSGTDLTVYGITVGRGAGAVATNTAVGASALGSHTSGAFNVAVGANAAANATSFANATVVGMNAIGTGIATGTYITAIGTSALQKLTSGSYVTGVGVLALKENTSGNYNTALGVEALQANTTASNNTAVGFQAGYTNQTGFDNTFLGFGAAANVTTSYNTLLGLHAGYGYGGTSSGNGSNVMVGWKAGYKNTSGSGNTFVGTAAGYENTTGIQNTFVGPNTGSTSVGYYVTTGSKNTILGAYNGNQNALDIRTASNYAVISDGDGNLFLVHRKDYGLVVANRSQIASAWEAIQNKSQINMYEGTNGNFEIASGYSTSDFVVGTGGTTGNVAYGANGGSYLSVASGIMAIIGSTFTIGSNTYTVTSESSEGYVYCSPDASGEAATGTLVGLKYATEGFRVYDNRTAQFKSTVGVGGTAGSTSGAGITFPATQNASSNANTLDDYEEGSFTPTIATGSANVTYSQQSGNYTKVGRLVTFGISIVLNTVTSVGSGDFEIGGLPFASSSSDVNQTRLVCQTSSVNFDATAYQFYAYTPTTSSSVFRVLYSYDNGAWSPAQASNFVIAAGSIIVITGFYYTNT